MFLKVKCVKVGARGAVAVRGDVVSSGLCREPCSTPQQVPAGSGIRAVESEDYFVLQLVFFLM